MSTTFVILATILAAGVILFWPRLTGNPLWRATITPLASIIGSGFLVAGPILGQVASHGAVIAMAGLCLIAWLFGTAIRYNIGHVETISTVSTTGRVIRKLQTLSQAVLAFAYIISVAYYLNLFGAFLLKIWGVTDPWKINLVTTSVLAGLGWVGLKRGLDGLELVELGAVGIKLAVIAGLIAGLTIVGVNADWTSISFTQVKTPGTDEIRVLFGLVILVQGFETSRFLGHKYDAPTRIRTMKYAQVISTLIYIAFIGLLTPFLVADLPAQGGETAIIDILKPHIAIAGSLIILAALMSQLSAAIADTSGGGGLLAELTGNRSTANIGYTIICGLAIALTWSSGIFQIIAYASRAFALFYGLQAAIAALHAFNTGKRAQSAGFGLLVVLSLAITLLGKAAEGG